MTRSEARKLLVSIGVAEPTEEQVTKYLDSVDGETKAEKAKAEKYKADADKAKDLQKQLDDLQDAQLSDIEKANKAVEEANKRIAELEAKEFLTNQRNSAMEKFNITAEQAKEVCKDDGSFDFDVLGKIISEKETAAATAKEQEIANGADNPNGGSGSGSKDEKSEADKLAESIGKSAGNNNETTKAVLDSYL